MHGYERGLTEYAADPVRVSLKPLVWQRRLARPDVGGLARVATPIAAPVAAARR
ncbi:hypothetical protein [Streptomyces sp. NPDC006875]|uniref:hypothetical protein n=1 Tax=Streptomyces sp. NPDC006875 TaxID=3154781 RepID=UPI00340983EF